MPFRTLQRDPLGYADSLNTYAYTVSNPVNYIDPFGLSTSGGQGNVGAGKPQNSYVGLLTGYSVPGPFNMVAGSGWVDPTLGLANDALNVVQGAGVGLLIGLGTVDDAITSVTGCDASCQLAVAASLSPGANVVDASAAGLRYGLGTLGRWGRAIAAETGQLGRMLASERGAVGAAEDAFAAVMRKVETLDFRTPHNSAVFYSGPGQGARAQLWAETHGKMTIEMTRGGKTLAADQTFQSLSPAQQYQVWQKASVPFSEGASGRVNAFINGARPEGTFRMVEEPILYNNPNISRYIYRY